MRTVHPSYEAFIKEQKPKYGHTFIDWYAINAKFQNIDFLSELQKRNKFFVETEFQGFHEEQSVGCFKDFFTKKLQLCSNLINDLVPGNQFEPIIKYDIDIVADVMDLYEDIIQYVCTMDNIYVSTLPTVLYKNRVWNTKSIRFQSFEDFKNETENGTVIVYCFKIIRKDIIEIRYEKREPLTRTVLFEGNNN